MYPNGANPPFQAMRPPQTWSNVNIPPITDPSQCKILFKKFIYAIFNSMFIFIIIKKCFH